METGGILSMGGGNPLKGFSPKSKPVGKKEKGGEKEDSKPSPVARRDSVEISDAAKNQSRLLQVRERLKKGFYDSDTVRDVVSDKLSGVMQDEVE